MSPEDFSFPDHRPLFVDEVLSGSSLEVVDACGISIQCIFDATVTGNLDVGLETLEMDETNQENNIIACKYSNTLAR